MWLISIRSLVFFSQFQDIMKYQTLNRKVQLAIKKDLKLEELNLTLPFKLKKL